MNAAGTRRRRLVATIPLEMFFWAKQRARNKGKSLDWIVRRAFDALFRETERGEEMERASSPQPDAHAALVAEALAILCGADEARAKVRRSNRLSRYRVIEGGKGGKR